MARTETITCDVCGDGMKRKQYSLRLDDRGSVEFMLESVFKGYDANGVKKAQNKSEKIKCSIGDICTACAEKLSAAIGEVVQGIREKR